MLLCLIAYSKAMEFLMNDVVFRMTDGVRPNWGQCGTEQKNNGHTTHQEINYTQIQIVQSIFESRKWLTLISRSTIITLPHPDGINHGAKRESWRKKHDISKCAKLYLFIYEARQNTVRPSKYLSLPEGCWNRKLERVRPGAARLLVQVVRSAEWGTRQRRDWNWS